MRQVVGVNTLLIALFVVVLSSTARALTPKTNSADPISFWNTPQHGADCFNQHPPDEQYFRALKAYGASWVRISFEKWKPAQRDFLVGNADHYTGLNPRDMATLKAVLDRAHAAGLKVVITTSTLPGYRAKEDKSDAFDDRLWQDKAYWAQSQAYWRDLARALKDNSAVAAYNLVNEPAPERKSNLGENADAADMQRWYRSIQGSARDLPAFYCGMIKAIREVDPVTPIMVDSGWYASPDDFAYWPDALKDSRILYDYHMYEPWSATSAPNIKRAKPYLYPGKVPFGGSASLWDAQRVATFLQKPLDWAQTHNIPTSRLVVGEFGCMRRLPFCRQYLEDVLTVLDKQRVSWAFYAFREDDWDGMDYELGSAKVPWAYWKAVSAGKAPTNLRKVTPESSRSSNG